MSTETNPPTTADPTSVDGWDRPPAWTDNWELLTDVGPETAHTDRNDTDVEDADDDLDDTYDPEPADLSLRTAIGLLDGTEEYRSPADGEALELLPRTDEGTAARVRLAGVYAQVATAEAITALDDTVLRLNALAAIVACDVAQPLGRLAAAADRQTAVLAEIALSTERARRQASDRASALIDAEYADSTSRSGLWAVAALVVAIWAGIGGPRPDWSWMPQDALPGWLPAAAGFTAVALAAIGALLAVARYGETRYRWSHRG